LCLDDEIIFYEFRAMPEATRTSPVRLPVILG
jgi:hypothetical protein